MEKTISSFLFISSIILYQSCTAKILISDKKYAPTDPEKIELYYSKLPQREYDEIAIVYPANGYSQSITEFKKAAANPDEDEFDYISWLESKIRNKPFLEVIREKNIKENAI